MVVDREGWPAPLSSCPTFEREAPRFRVRDRRLLEVSGIGMSRRQPGRTWLHNDSGDEARLLAVEDGNVVAELRLAGLPVFDAEDLAVAEGPNGTPWLYLADTGDNRLQRRQGVVVLRTPEPAFTGTQASPLEAERVERLHLRYPSGPRDTEALLLDPLRQELVLISKGRDGTNLLFSAPVTGFVTAVNAQEARAQAGLPAATLMRLSGRLRLGLVTSADISADGRWIAVRTYTDAWVWPRRPDESVTDALLGPACKVPLADEPQGEAIAWEPSGRGYYTLSEGFGQPLHYFRRVEPPAAAGAPLTYASPATAPLPATPQVSE